MTLSLKVSLIVGALVLLLMVGMAVTSNMIASGIMEETAKKSLQNQSTIAAQLVADGIIKADLNVLYELANRARTKTMVWETQRDSLLPEIDRHGYLDFGIVGLDGVTHYIRDNTISNLGDRDYIIKAMDGKLVVSDVLISRVTGKPVVMFAAPIFVNDKVAGVLIGRRDGAVLTNMTNAIGLGDTGYVYMINAQGTVICHPDTNLVYNQFNPRESVTKEPSLRPLASFVENILNNSNEVAEYTFGGKSLISASAKVPGTDWFLIGTVEREEFFFGINQMLVKTLVMAGVAALVAVCILISVLSVSLIRPIKAVVTAAKSLASMQFDIDLPMDRKDEIGDVQRAFHTIREALKKTITDINNEHMGQKNVSGNLHISIRESSDGLGVISRN
ncbi:MAG: Cache 3/Cache 2 fusion domain-containing protein, partial [Treponema sp.]|nr:Cache 3/Cache 2 fusion domain-containing protein [Treponema sp.]